MSKRVPAIMIAVWIAAARGFGVDASELQWSKLPPLPNRLGVAGAFAGVSGGVLLVGGGANFPGEMPWEGGKKVWHDTVYALGKTNGAWRVAGRLPHPLGYGVALTTQRGVLCIGGCDAERHYADVFLLVHARGNLKAEPLPSLPVPLANSAGALLGHTVYVAGGSERPGEQSALNRCFSLELSGSNSAWREVAPCPWEARILPVGGAADGAFYLAGGAALRPVEGKIKRAYLRDVWRLMPKAKWERLADLPRPCVAGPTPAPVVDSSLLLIGGDDGSLVDFQPLDQHPGFPRTIQAFSLTSGQWVCMDVLPAARAVLPVVEWKGLFVLPSGEVRPGARSPEVWAFRVNRRR
jgi:N-acetylneuraminate epimerase